jgi:uncharacterized protein with PIN domain
MAQAIFLFYAELNDFLPTHKRQVPINYQFTEKAAIKDMIEALGVPHPEVDCIQVNGKGVDFAYIVNDGDNIHVYPISVNASQTSTSSLRPKMLREMRFVLDIHLGKLANSLRMLGFDTLYRNDYHDEELAYISSTEDRMLLTRDKGLLMRSVVTYGYYVRNTNPQMQIVEVLRRFDLFKIVSPFVRCIRCNGLLKSVPKEAIINQLPESVQLQVNEFRCCQECGQIYWKGSHYEKMQQFIAEVMGND